MPITYVEKQEWLENMQKETLLLGAFAPPLDQITMEIECKECGRPVYVSPYERGATVICIACGLKYFNESDREALAKRLLPQGVKD